MAQPRIIIVGGGFGGLAVAKALKNAPAEIILIDRTNHHLFQPLLYQVATSVLAPSQIGFSDSLIGYQKNREYRERQQELVVAAQDAARLSELRYRGGATGYLEVLTNETNAFNAELALTQAQLNELVSLVDIYRNLGGGWDS
jgi:2-polyprenyl-6-methoxyphenol hydroxylase-like FAD-dependent oxidoreductase